MFPDFSPALHVLSSTVFLHVGCCYRLALRRRMESMVSPRRTVRKIASVLLMIALPLALSASAIAQTSPGTDNLTGEVKQMTEDWIPIIIMLVFVGLGLSFIMALFTNFHRQR
jgi:hypothetical protein